MINLTINILYPILALIAMVMLAHRKKEAFIVFLIVEVMMVYLGVEGRQFGIVVMAVIYFITNIYAYRKWSK